MKSLSVKLGVILIMVVILGNVKVCNAECAWVLWERTGQRLEGRFQWVEWHVNSAFPTYDLCTQRRIKEFNYYKEIYIYNYQY